jgi:hypothetical protein
MGGYRAQGGRVPKIKPGSPPVRLPGPFSSAAEFLMAVINSAAPLDLKVRAAISLLPFQGVRADERGKKDLAEERAEEAAQGVYAPPPQPKRPN